MKKSIINYPNYEIDNNGIIYNKYGNQISPCKNNKGYLRVSLSHNTIKKSFLIHRLVAIHFIPNLNNYDQVNHIDGNKTNNSITNLEWCSASDNIKHSFKIGKSNYKGENNGRCKISNIVISQIKDDFKQGLKRKELSLKYNISYSHIVSILSNKRR